MKNTNLENIRLIDKSFSYISGYFLGGFPNKKELTDGFPSLFNIDETRYKWSEVFYKLGLKSTNPTINSNSYYSSDLASIIKSNNVDNESVSFGFYEVKSLDFKDVESLQGKVLLINAAKNGNSEELIETAITVHLEVDETVRIDNITSAVQNVEFMSLEDFVIFANDDFINLRELVLLKGEDGKPETWLREQSKLASEQKYGEVV